jgi:hypothetical protein
MTAALSEAAQLPRAPTRKLYEAAVLCTASVITVYACCVNSTHACASPVDVREYTLKACDAMGCGPSKPEGAPAAEANVTPMPMVRYMPTVNSVLLRYPPLLLTRAGFSLEAVGPPRNAGQAGSGRGGGGRERTGSCARGARGDRSGGDGASPGSQFD